MDSRMLPIAILGSWNAISIMYGMHRAIRQCHICGRQATGGELIILICCVLHFDGRLSVGSKENDAGELDWIVLWCWNRMVVRGMGLFTGRWINQHIADAMQANETKWEHNSTFLVCSKGLYSGVTCRWRVERTRDEKKTTIEVTLCPILRMFICTGHVGGIGFWEHGGRSFCGIAFVRNHVGGVVIEN